MPHDRPHPLRTALLVPASRPEWMPRALASGADCVIVDLADAATPDDRDSARAALAACLPMPPDTCIAVRVNGRATPWFDDARALRRALPGLRATLLPKAESAAQTGRARLPGVPVWPLIESAAGLLALAGIVRAEGVERLAYDRHNLGMDLGLTPDSD